MEPNDDSVLAPSGRPAPAASPRWIHALLLLLFGLAVYLPGIGGRALWNPDEPRYTEVAREMVASGEWLVPHINQRLYAQKPPLHFWAIALFGLARGGVDEVAARLPAVTACLVSLLLVYLMGCRLYSRTTGLLGALIFGSCGKILWQGRIGQIDMTLAALVLCAVWCWLRSWQGERHWIWGFWIASGFATMAKGPVGLLPALCSIAVFLLVTRDFAGLRRLCVVRGLLVWAGVVLLWLGPAVAVQGRGYLDYLIFGQTFHRYLAATGHLHPFYYYLTQVPGDFFPYAFLLPLMLTALLGRGSPLDRESRQRIVWPLCWAVVTVLFFSVSAGKRSVYIVPIYAPLALLVAAGVELLRRHPRFARGWWLASVGPVALLGLLLPIALPAIAQRQPELTQVFGQDIVTRGLLSVAPLSLGTLLALLPAWRRKARGIVFCWAFGAAATATVATTIVLPRVDATKSEKPLAERLLSLARPGEPYGLYPLLEGGFLFYTRQPAVELCGPEQVVAYAQGEGRRWLLIESDDLAALGERLPMVEIARDQDWQEGFVLLTTPPWPRPPGEPETGDTIAATRRANRELHGDIPANPCTGGLSVE